MTYFRDTRVLGPTVEPKTPGASASPRVTVPGYAVQGQGLALDYNGALPNNVTATFGYGTKLPTNPTDGQQFILVDSAIASSWQWCFRYNTRSTSAYKWEYVGGTPIHVDHDAADTTTSGSGADLGGPYVTLPRSGLFFVAIGCAASPNVTGVANTSIGLANQAGTIQFGTVMSLANQPVGGYVCAMSRSFRTIQGNAGDVWKTLYSISNGLSTSFSARWIDLWPLKVA